MDNILTNTNANERFEKLSHARELVQWDFTPCHCASSLPLMLPAMNQHLKGKQQWENPIWLKKLTVLPPNTCT